MVSSSAFWSRLQGTMVIFLPGMVNPTYAVMGLYPALRGGRCHPVTSTETGKSKGSVSKPPPSNLQGLLVARGSRMPPR